MFQKNKSKCMEKALRVEAAAEKEVEAAEARLNKAYIAQDNAMRAVEQERARVENARTRFRAAQDAREAIRKANAIGLFFGF